MSTIEEWAPHTRFEATIIDNLTRSQIVQYAGASGDFNPIHTDEVYATAVAGLPGVFGHGMLTMGAAGAFVQSLVGPENLRSFTVRFAEKVWPGDTLTAAATVTNAIAGDEPGLAIDLELTVANQDAVVVIRGHVQADVPPGFSPGREPTKRTRSENTHA